jgi:hypothetical protein
MKAQGSFTRAGLALAATSLAALIASCGAAKTPTDVACAGGETRTQIDCSSEISYQGYSTKGGFGVMNLASGEAKHEDIALRRVDENTEQFVAMQTRLCRDYNACVLDKDAYAQEARTIRERLGRVPALISAIRSAGSDDERRRAIDELYRDTVPEDKRVEEVTFRLGMDAELPDSAGGGKVGMRPGMPLPTNAKVAFTVEVSPEAYLYIFQKAPGGGITVLFPDERIGTQNPLRGGARIPTGSMRFRLNDQDVGTEQVFIAASRKPIPNLEASLKRVSSGQIESMKDDSLLKSFDRVPAEEPKTKCRAFVLDTGSQDSGCTRSRGLVLEDSDGSSSSSSSTASPAIAARTEPGDDVIVKVFAFNHTTEPQYVAMAKEGKTRGGNILEKGPRGQEPDAPRSRGGNILEKGPRDQEPDAPRSRGGNILE